MARSRQRTSSTTLRRPCSTTSRATTRSSACRPSTPAPPSSTRLKNSGRSPPRLSSAYSPLPRRFTGIEFALAHASPPSLFIIHKRERLDPDQGPSISVPSPLTSSPPVRPLAAYFIINNRIYQSPDVYTLLSNRLVLPSILSPVAAQTTLIQLTSLNALQSSLDLLRRHRPDYTPRSGFVWPIIDSSPDTPPKKSDLAVLHSDDPAVDAPERHKLHGPKKQQNNSLMVYAMRTTAIHSNITPSRPLTSASAPATASAQPALTPAPSSQRTPTPKAPSTAPSPQDPPIKGPAGAGKKKKKRTSLLSRVSNPLTHAIGTSVLVA